MSLLRTLEGSFEELMGYTDDYVYAPHLVPVQNGHKAAPQLRKELEALLEVDDLSTLKAGLQALLS